MTTSHASRKQPDWLVAIRRYPIATTVGLTAALAVAGSPAWPQERIGPVIAVTAVGGTGPTATLAWAGRALPPRMSNHPRGHYYE